MGIVLYHVNGSFSASFSSILDPIYQYGGYFGNYFFFMLSGFLIAHSYKKTICNNQISVTAFIGKRLRKLYPLYILSTVVQLALIVYENGLSALNLKTVLLNVLMITSGWVDDIYPFNTPLWFVSMLLLCYFAYFFICRISKKSRNKYLALITLVVFWGYVLENKSWDFPFCYVHDGEGFLNFFTGCLVYELYASLSDKKKYRMTCVGMGLMAGTFLLSMCYGFNAVAGDVRLVITLLICPTVIFCALELNWLEKLLNLKPFLALGMISTSIYFWHIPLVTFTNIVRKNLPAFSPQIEYLIYLCVLIVVSYLSYLLIEKRLVLRTGKNTCVPVKNE